MNRMNLDSDINKKQKWLPDSVFLLLFHSITSSVTELFYGCV